MRRCELLKWRAGMSECPGERLPDWGRLEASIHGSDEARSWWATFEAVAENDLNLAASCYKPRVAEEVPDEDPPELIREVLGIVKEITAGLTKLLKEIEE